MADVTGPIHTLPGAGHAVPDGMMCDDHPDRPATHRVQGETDSMGCEMWDMCDECFKEHKKHGVYSPENCDWCKKKASDIRPTRDYEEGMCGPVYYVCAACRKRRDERIAEEDRDYDDFVDDDWDDDDNVEECAERWEDDDIPADPPPHKVLVTCRCGQKWDPKHKCRKKRIATTVSDRTT
jgi:hypothetical protein